MQGVLNSYVTNPNPTPTLTPNPNRYPNSNPNQINEKIQKETTLEIDQITKCQFGRWKLVKTDPKWQEVTIFYSNIRTADRGSKSQSHFTNILRTKDDQLRIVLGYRRSKHSTFSK